VGRLGLSAGGKANDEVTTAPVRRRLHITGGGACETSREGKSQASPGEGTIALARAASYTRFEDALAFAWANTRPVIPDREHDFASAALDAEGHVRCGALARVLHYGLQDAQRHLRVETDEHSRYRWLHPKFHASFAGQLATGRGHLVEHDL
jgi:hypothetical protein